MILLCTAIWLLSAVLSSVALYKARKFNAQSLQWLDDALVHYSKAKTFHHEVMNRDR